MPKIESLHDLKLEREKLKYELKLSDTRLKYAWGAIKEDIGSSARKSGFQIGRAAAGYFVGRALAKRKIFPAVVAFFLSKFNR
jgi:hypothetical protein